MVPGRETKQYLVNSSSYRWEQLLVLPLQYLQRPQNGHKNGGSRYSLPCYKHVVHYYTSKLNQHAK